MSKKLFSDEEIDVLSRNKYVKSVSKCGITYSDGFKSMFIAEYDKGYLPTQIFLNAGFEDILGNLNQSKKNTKVSIISSMLSKP